MKYIYIGIGGFLGTIARYLILYYYQNYYNTIFPFATFFINISGSFLLSYISNLTFEKYNVDINIRLAITNGFIGAFTTFSTFTADTIGLLRNGMILIALIYVLLSTLLGFAMSFVGIELSDMTVNLFKGREES